MKKLLITGSSQGCYGGIEAFMIALAEAASQWEGLEVRLAFKLVKGAEASEDLKKPAMDSCPSVYFIRRGSGELMKLLKWADIVHAQNMPPDIVIPARLMGRKLYLTVHNRRMKISNLHHLIWELTIRMAHQRWYNSNFVWSSWEPGKKSPNSACIPTVCKLPQRWRRPEQRRGFLFVGRWIENKGIEEILGAYALCGFNSEAWPLTILGSGPLQAKIFALAKTLKLNNVNFPGFVSDDEKAEYISSAKWLLAPAKTQEDLGLTPIEARSAGVPSIVTQDGGLPEAGGRPALIARPGDVQDLALRMKEAARMHEEEYLQRSILCISTLNSFLKPMEFYRDIYLGTEQQIAYEI